MIATKRLTKHTFLALFAVLALLATASEALAAELFWDRPDAFGLRYEIHLDGTTQTTTDGMSFFDDIPAAGAYLHHNGDRPHRATLGSLDAANKYV